MRKQVCSHDRRRAATHRQSNFAGSELQRGGASCSAIPKKSVEDRARRNSWNDKTNGDQESCGPRVLSSRSVHDAATAGSQLRSDRDFHGRVSHGHQDSSGSSAQVIADSRLHQDANSCGLRQRILQADHVKRSSWADLTETHSLAEDGSAQEFLTLDESQPSRASGSFRIESEYDADWNEAAPNDGQGRMQHHQGASNQRRQLREHIAANADKASTGRARKSVKETGQDEHGVARDPFWIGCDPWASTIDDQRSNCR